MPGARLLRSCVVSFWVCSPLFSLSPRHRRPFPSPPRPPPPLPAVCMSGSQCSAAAAEPLAHRSILADTHEWEHSAADRDVDEADDAAADALLSAIAGSEAAADQALQAKIAAARAATEARAAAHSGFASFVKESREVEMLLQSLPYAASSAPRLCDIFDLYQEQCELLDPHLPHAVTALMNYVHSVIRPGKVNPLPPANSMTGAIKVNKDGSAAAVESAVYTPTGPACNSTELLTRVFKVIYSLAKVRGYKTILHFFPHEVADLEPALALLQKQSMEQHETWETRYGILLWISIIVLIPFDLNSVDSTMATPAAAVSSSAPATLGPGGVALGSTGIISSLISLGCMYLSDTGPPREAAAVMLSKLFSRADMHARHLAAFFQWCTNEITRVNAEQSSKVTGAGTAANASKNVFLLTGIFRALVQTFRHAPRDVLRRHVAQVFPSVLLPQADTWTATSNTLLRKLFVKLAQRVGLTYLPVRVAKWRYQRGHRSLLTTLQQATASSSSAAPSNPALGSAHAVAKPASSPSDEIDPEDDDVPDEIETIIQILLDGLRDRDTIVRWSSAKGIGRLTNCLSATFGDDVVGAVLDLFTGREGDAAWHGGCLALAELARRGLLLPQRLDAVVPITLRALTYDQRTATHSVGAHVRDASCYVIWAFARAYAPDVMAPYMNRMAQGLMTICVFDREVNVRRASSAAFQEHVGRQGSSSFPHGMAILQLADYFTIANRSSAYTVVAFQVAQYPEYTLGLVDHLLEYKVKHWEKEVRALTAQSMGILTKRNAQSAEYMREFVMGSLLTTAVNSTDLLEKHGALLSVASILQSLWEMDSKDYLPMPLRNQICDVVNRLSSPAHASLLNGRGGQIMREALCGVIEAVARTHMLTSSPAMMQYMRAYQTILDENLQHSNEEVQVAATRAIEQFVRAYYLPSSSDDAKLTAEKLARARPVMDHYTRTLLHPSSLAGATRGFASALGTLPRALLITTTAKAAEVYAAVPNASAAAASSASSSSAAAASPALPSVMPTASSVIYQPLSRILQSLILTASECAQGDAETRRNAVQALVRLIDTLTDDDLLQFMTPMPPPPAAASVTVAPPPASAAGGASAAAREKEAKLAAKHAKVHTEALSKYWHRDLNELGLGTNANRVVDRVATTLLVCLDDYATDNRGDVGSWVREAAMVGLEAMLHKLARMQQASPDAVVFLPLLSARVFPALLKQSVEKIDRVREKAGQIFFRLLWSGAAPAAAIGVAANAVEIPFIPARDELRARFPFTSAASGTSASARSVREDKSVDWSSPSQTFPLLVPLLALPLSPSEPHVYPYHRSLLSGLLISVGGLTESVVKSSSEAFLAYVSGLSSAISSKGEDAGEELARLKYLAESMLAILLSEKGHARVVVPAFKTLELLLSNGLLEPLSLDVSSFASSLQSRVWKEVSASQNIHKLMACIPVLVGLLAYPAPLRTTTLSNLLTLLGHATFPKVRRLTAEALYNALLISGEELIPGADEDPDKAQPVLDIMTLTPWDGPVGPARTERDKLYELLQVPKPKLKAKAAGAAGGAGAGAAANQGDISALSNEYSSLVRQIGY